MWKGLGFVCPGAGRGPLGLYLLQSQNRLGVCAALTALGHLTWSKFSPLHLQQPHPLCKQSPSQMCLPLCLAGEKHNPTFLHCTHRANILVTFPCTKTNSDFPHPFQWACGNRLTKQLLFTISKYCSVWHKSRELFCFWWIYLVSWLQTSLGERCDFYLTCCGSFVLLNTGPWHKRGFAVTLFAEQVWTKCCSNISWWPERFSYHTLTHTLLYDNIRLTKVLSGQCFEKSASSHLIILFHRCTHRVTGSS